MARYYVSHYHAPFVIFSSSHMVLLWILLFSNFVLQGESSQRGSTPRRKTYYYQNHFLPSINYVHYAYWLILGLRSHVQFVQPLNQLLWATLGNIWYMDLQLITLKLYCSSNKWVKFLWIGNGTSLFFTSPKFDEIFRSHASMSHNVSPYEYSHTIISIYNYHTTQV